MNHETTAATFRDTPTAVQSEFATGGYVTDGQAHTSAGSVFTEGCITFRDLFNGLPTSSNGRFTIQQWEELEKDLELVMPRVRMEMNEPMWTEDGEPIQLPGTLVDVFGISYPVAYDTVDVITGVEQITLRKTKDGVPATRDYELENQTPEVRDITDDELDDIVSRIVETLKGAVNEI